MGRCRESVAVSAIDNGSLNMVAKGGKMPSMDKVKKISVSIPEGTIVAIKAMAEQEGRSFSNMLALLAREGLKKKAA
jgi:hypothetical protein